MGVYIKDITMPFCCHECIFMTCEAYKKYVRGGGRTPILDRRLEDCPLIEVPTPSAEAVMRDATAEERASVQRYIDSISTEAVQLKQTDTLIIADALRYLAQDTERHPSDRARAEALREQILQYGARMCKGGDDE